MRTVHALSLTVALLWLGSGPAVALFAPQSDSRTWYQAYADARRQIDSGDYAAAVASLQRAKQVGPRPGRNVPSVGDTFVDFLPDYYLGVAFLKLGRFSEAVAAFYDAQATVGEQDPEYEDLTAQLAQAQQAEQAQAAQQAQQAAPPRLPQAAGNTPPAAGQIGQLPNQPPDVTQAPPPSAAGPGPDQQLAATNLPGAPSGSTRPAGAPPSPTPTPRAPARPPAGSSTAPAAAVERTAIAQFLSGQYAEAEALLIQLVNAQRDTPRSRLYLACSRAALVLVGQADPSTLDAERARVASLNLGQFSEDLRYVSPSVLKELGTGQ